MIAKIRRFLTVRRAQSETPLQREQRKNIALHFELAAANKRAEWAIAQLKAIHDQRSDIVRRGNITRRLKREAAAKASA